MLNNTGVQQEYVTHTRNYDYEVVCGSANGIYPEEYEIPRENTGTLKDQGTVGACVAEVIAQIAENWYTKETNEPSEMSEGFIYGAYREDNSISVGLVVSKAMDLWTSIGTLPKEYFDILVEMPEIKKMVAKIPELKEIASRYRLKGYVAINHADRDKKDMCIKDALTKYQYGLVAVSTKGFQEGSHCIQLTGWDDKKGKYKFKNSWGEKYGDNGFGSIDKSKINQVYLPLFEDITLPFEDVKETDWFFKDVKDMYFPGIIKGITATTFEPNKNLTRAEAVALINRVYKEMDRNNDILNKVINEKLAILETRR